MEPKRKHRKRPSRKKTEVKTRRSDSATGQTVEVFIVCEETRPSLAIPSCLESHKARRLTTEVPKEEC
jgi:hypothetical protein